MSESSNSLEKEVEDYQDISSGSGGSYDSGEGSISGGSSSVVHLFSPSSSFLSFLTLICFLCHRNSYHDGKQGEGCYQWR